jgi:hypothetical protein
MKLLLLAFLISTQAFSQVSNPRHRPGYCPIKENLSCENFIIKNVPRWDSDEEYELKKIKYSCAGNYNIDCLKTISAPLPRYNKNNLEDLSRLALSCQLTNNECVKFLKSNLARIHFNNIEDVTKVARACARADVSCISQKCNLRDYNCNRSEDLIRAASSCYQPCKR